MSFTRLAAAGAAFTPARTKRSGVEPDPTGQDRPDGTDRLFGPGPLLGAVSGFAEQSSQAGQKEADEDPRQRAERV
jgi:hypothetical protein